MQIQSHPSQDKPNIIIKRKDRLEEEEEEEEIQVSHVTLKRVQIKN